jgi:hypothetical protein
MHCLADLKLLLINVDSKMCNAMSSCQPKWVEEVEHSYATDPSSQEMIAKLALDGGDVPHFSWSRGLLRYKSRIWVGADHTL